VARNCVGTCELVDRLVRSTKEASSAERRNGPANCPISERRSLQFYAWSCGRRAVPVGVGTEEVMGSRLNRSTMQQRD
jgi:hypothetical protein